MPVPRCLHRINKHARRKKSGIPVDARTACKSFCFWGLGGWKATCHLLWIRAPDALKVEAIKSHTCIPLGDKMLRYHFCFCS